MEDHKQIQVKVDEWIKWDKNAHTSGFIRQLANERNYEALSELLLKRINFGTAGLRGLMSAGYTCINDLVIIQTSQGLLKFLEKNRGELLHMNGIIVGFDGRHDSERFARFTAVVFVNAGYKVRLAQDVNPTPFIPLAVKVYNLACGVMVTASHNPKDDNGYKVYDSNSAQIIPPVDEHIQESILENLEPLEDSWKIVRLRSNPLVTNHLEELTALYMRDVILDRIFTDEVANNYKVGLDFVYTAMHGVGWAVVEQVIRIIDGNYFPVEEQRQPNADFPTVKFPNPEEGKSSLDMSFQYADQIGSKIILANDPDADRFAAAEKNSRTGKWHIFTGNELGALLGWWMLQSHKKYNPDVPLNQVYMISSTVSSMILKTMAKAEGFNFVDTLTGFKWIGNKALDLKEEGFTVIFAFEEAIGFMCNDVIMDKDGISALAHFVCLASHVYDNGKQLHEHLDELYDTYGLHLSLNSYYYCRERETIKKIFKRIRNMNGPNEYPTGIMNNKFKIVSVRDLTTGYDNSQLDNFAVLPVSDESEMITFVFDNGLQITLRTSGTEPKIKYYSELILSPDVKGKSAALATLEEMVSAICKEFLEPEKNRLIPKPK